MFRTIADFETTWTQENERTSKLLEALTDASLAQQVMPEGRSLGRLAWHLLEGHGSIGVRAGLALEARFDETPQPSSAAEIAAAYDASAKAFLAAVKAGWTDADLPVEVIMYDRPWSRGMSLDILVMHEIHHRGQMTVLMRQAGLKVPGIYGPAREEWAATGKPTQD